jgi:cell wall-associated NlpC family hydrolase
MHLSAEHWANLAQRPDEVLLDERGLVALADKSFAGDPNMVDLAAYAQELSGADVSNVIISISKRYETELFYRDGGKVEDSDYARYQAKLNLDALHDIVKVRFALVLQRADMRTWPTVDVVFKSQETFDLDRFQENGLFPADMVAVLHESKDGEWYFVQSFNYAAWVRKDNIAIGQRAEILAYRNAARFLVVTGSKVRTNFNPYAAGVSELQLDMGIRLPLADLADSSDSVAGQNPLASHAVQLPVREDQGELGFRTALIARSQDVRQGYLPFTRRNIVEQAFKFLGERYGWGHSYNARDCTGLIAEVYKTFGIQLPRNSGQQGSSPIGESVEFDTETSDEEKLLAILSADAGDLLYSTGHVMLYLGAEDAMPYVIHDLSGYGWAGVDGEVQEGALNGVSVTPLIPLHSSRDSTYFEEIYAIKQIR